MTQKDWSSFDKLDWRRRLETFGEDDGPIIAAGPKGEIDGVCQLGELTDKGRETTLAVGQRLRHLYVDQLGFMPKIIMDADMIYLRATPMARALESLQQSFVGMYPLNTRTGSFPPPTIITRAPADETLFPNESNCRRFSQLSRAFGQRTADRWNKTTEMDYLNSLISKWMPEDSKRVAVDSHPRLSGIMDTVNSTLAHGPKTRLPAAFYDPKGREIIDKIGVEEWFSGFHESNEYRTVGIGGLVGDVVSRMVGTVERNGNDGILEVGGDVNEMGKGRGGEKRIKFGMSGCHDTTLAAVLTSLGAFEGEPWPSYTSHIAVELFRRSPSTNAETTPGRSSYNETNHTQTGASENRSFWSSLFGAAKQKAALETPSSQGVARQKVDTLSTMGKKKLDGYYVRVRYNDRVMTVPGCKAAGNHLDGDESFCTLEAFKRIADKFTPRNWKQACAANLDQPAFPARIEEAGY
ncbi:hypothetical protein MMC26_005209 [Xylographa opegraphella]|nr:hypothetical protein [Xylographa opegraphella]